VSRVEDVNSEQDDLTIQGALQMAQRSLQRIDELELRVEELARRVEANEQRTSVHDRVQRASALKPAERAVVLIQTLYNNALAKEKRSSADGMPTASMDVNSAVDCLGGSVDRTLMYGETGVFKKAVDLVGDENVLYYQKEPRGAKKNSRLILDLEAGELPDKIEGFEIEEEP